MFIDYSKIIKTVTVFFVVSVVFVSCSTTGDSSSAQQGRIGDVADPVFYGQGSGPSSMEAIQQARKAAVRKAADALLGKAAAKGQKSELDELFGSIDNIEPYMFEGSQETVASSNTDGFYYHLGIRINLEELAAMLESSNILGGQVNGKSGNVYRLSDQPFPTEASAPDETASIGTQAEEVETSLQASPERAEVEDVADVSAEELSVIRDYLNSLTYMVYFNEETAADPFLSRTAVLSANRYLEQQGFEYVDLEQIERIKEDQEIVYEEETGEAVSMIQWIAHKLNADVYIELSLNTSSKIEQNKYYGSATVNLNCYNASTAEGLGSAVYQTIPPAFSKVSEDDALANAVSAAVFNGMKEAVVKVEKESARVAAKGFKYNLIMINTFDSKTMREFEKDLERKAKKVKRVSYSPEESIFEVYLIGDIADLEDIVYDIAEIIPGMEGVLLVMQRGNSITFDTGM